MNRRRVGRAAPMAAVLAIMCLAAVVPGAATPAGRAECRSAPSRILGHAVPYCVVLPPGYDQERTRRYPVLYFLHGLGGNAQLFLSSGALDLIEDMWERGRLAPYLIVTPNGDTSFYINSHDRHDRYEDFFLGEFMPFIERHYRTLPGRRNRGIGGMSMGGYGSLHLAFAHPTLFGSVTASSPALLADVPRVRIAGGQEPMILRVLGGVFGSPFDPAFWDRNDPLHLARTANLRGLSIEFDCGEQDDYGFENGAEALHKILEERHIRHQFGLDPGGHDWEYFAAHLPAALEFHSHAFGLQTAREKP